MNDYNDRARIYWLGVALREIKSDIALYRQLLTIPQKHALAQSVLDGVIERIDEELGKDIAPEVASALAERYFRKHNNE